MKTLDASLSTRKRNPLEQTTIDQSSHGPVINIGQEKTSKVWVDPLVHGISPMKMATTQKKQLTISSSVKADSVIILFEDTGVGIASPDGLFKPFQSADATGLGLYVSRAILRSCGGDLTFEPREEGCCFAVSLARVVERHEASHG